MTTDTGIDVLGTLPWGTHVCHFFRSAEDLAETLVPFFKRGLERNESCLWVASKPFPAAAAARALGEVVPDLERRIARGQLEIVDHDDWYLRTGRADAEGTLAAWAEREQRALAQGFSGLRLTGNTAWLDRSSWSCFMEYESHVSAHFAPRRIVGLCSYHLDCCAGDQVLDVVRHHQSALARRDGVWEVVESAALKVAKQELAHANERLEARVAERTAQLEAALRARDEFLSVASHELKTPVAALQLILGTMRRGAERGTTTLADLGRRAQRAEDECERLARLVDDLLEVSRARTGLLELAPVRLDLADLAHDVAARLGPALQRAGCRVAVDAPAPVEGTWDRHRLEQVLSSLLANAARHAPGTEVRLTVWREGPRGVVGVRDFGPGVPADRRDRLFEAFARLGDLPSGGFGLGLWIARQLVQAHGGTITHEAPSDGGARFTVTLPLEPTGVVR